MKRIWVGILLLGWAGMALAIRPSEVRSRMEASMLVQGEITVDPQGGVTGYALDRRDKLPAAVVRYLEAAISGWTFEPNRLDGRPVSIRNRMELLLVARPIGDGDFRMELANASFRPVREAGYEVEREAMAPPAYPRHAAENQVSGTVYLVVKLAADGSVEQAVAEQVNLRVALSDPEMKRWRDVLARSAVTAAARWKFRLPTKGESANTSTWSLRIPVAYSLHDFGTDPQQAASAGYGKWESYIPGPRQQVPWIAGTDDVPLEALASGSLYPVGQDAGALKLAPPQADGG